jgi:hypothetical protein
MAMGEVMFVETDGGRKESGFGSEDYDCTVRALAHVSGLTYADCHRTAELAGRLYGCKSSMQRIINQAAAEGKIQVVRTHKYKTFFGQSALTCPTVAQWLKMPENCEGKFIVRWHGHVFAVINGVIFDSYPPRMGKRVMFVWKFA